MILHIFTLTLEPENPVLFSLPELRAYLTGKLNEYTVLRRDNSAGFIYRYPAVQVKLVKNMLMVVGISQGAGFLEEISKNQEKIPSGKNICTITARDSATRPEPFGISDSMITYEFLTPWLALNQQNTKKFYELKGKPDRDAFLAKLLSEGLATLAKSLDYKPGEPIRCEERVRFRKDWIDNKSVMVFTGKFRTNLVIPDYLGMGQSVSLGFGTIKHIPDGPEITDEENSS